MSNSYILNLGEKLCTELPNESNVQLHYHSKPLSEDKIKHLNRKSNFES